MMEPTSTQSPVETDWVHRLIFPCNEVVKLVSEAMDRPLPFGARLRLRVHLLLCDACARYRQHLTVLRSAMRHGPDKLMGREPSAGLSPEARERLKQALRRRRDK